MYDAFLLRRIHCISSLSVGCELQVEVLLLVGDCFGDSGISQADFRKLSSNIAQVIVS